MIEDFNTRFSVAHRTSRYQVSKDQENKKITHKIGENISKSYMR